MKKYLPVIALIALFWSSGCQSRTANAQVVSQPLIAPVAAASVPLQREAVDQCVVCHTDKDELISTAKPEEVVETESSGAG
jgi:hypothetical protein